MLENLFLDAFVDIQPHGRGKLLAVLPHIPDHEINAHLLIRRVDLGIVTAQKSIPQLPRVRNFSRQPVGEIVGRRQRKHSNPVPIPVFVGGSHKPGVGHRRPDSLQILHQCPVIVSLGLILFTHGSFLLYESFRLTERSPAEAGLLSVFPLELRPLFTYRCCKTRICNMDEQVF